MVRKATRVFVVADRSKLGRVTLASFGPIEGAHVLVTDSAAPQSMVRAIRHRRVQVMVGKAARCGQVRAAARFPLDKAARVGVRLSAFEGTSGRAVRLAGGPEPHPRRQIPPSHRAYDPTREVCTHVSIKKLEKIHIATHPRARLRPAPGEGAPEASKAIPKPEEEEDEGEG